VGCGAPSRLQYANPLLDKLDPYNYIRSRLYREHCTFHMVSARAREVGGGIDSVGAPVPRTPVELCGGLVG